MKGIAYALFACRLPVCRICVAALAAVFCLAGFGVLTGGKPLNKGLIAYYPFDESSSTVARDASGHGHHGKIHDAVLTAGKYGGALEFDDKGWVEIPDHESLRLLGDFTISAWVYKKRPSARGTSMGIVSKSTEDRWDYDLFMSTSSLEHPAFYSDAFQQPGGDIEVISDAPISLNQWHHIAVVRRGDKGIMYVDGQPAGRAIIPERLQTSNADLYIGHDKDGGFAGKIDEVRLYKESLDDEEIVHLALGGHNRPSSLTFEKVIVDTAYGGIRQLCDINGDGYKDIVHSYWYGGAPLAWYEYRPGTAWQKHIIRKDFYPVTDNFDLHDMDCDDDIDIVMAWSDRKLSADPKADHIRLDSVAVVYLENPGDRRGLMAGSWHMHTVGHHRDPGENYIKDIAAVDFDRDGMPEIAARSHATLSIFKMHGQFWKRIQYIEIHPHEGMDVGDVDGDGDPDVVLNGFWLECPEDPGDQWTEHHIDSVWYAQSGDWTANSCKVVFADIDGNGRGDVLLSHSERAGYPVSWYEAPGEGSDSWAEHVIDSVDFCHTLQAADMDGDGDMDVVAGEMEKSADPDMLVVFLNMDGKGFSWNRHIVARCGTYSAIVGDVGNDGDMDIVSNRNFNKPPLEIWLNHTISKTE